MLTVSGSMPGMQADTMKIFLTRTWSLQRRDKDGANLIFYPLHLTYDRA